MPLWGVETLPRAACISRKTDAAFRAIYGREAAMYVQASRPKIAAVVSWRLSNSRLLNRAKTPTQKHRQSRLRNTPQPHYLSNEQNHSVQTNYFVGGGSGIICHSCFVYHRRFSNPPLLPGLLLLSQHPDQPGRAESMAGQGLHARSNYSAGLRPQVDFQLEKEAPHLGLGPDNRLLRGLQPANVLFHSFQLF